MKPYEKTEEFRRLEKLADLQKRISGKVEDIKDSNGSIGLSSLDKSDIIPDSIKKVMVIRASMPIPARVLNSGIDDGMPSLISHLSRHKIMMSPGEAMYSAIGRKSNDIFEQVKNLTLGDIFSLIQNKAAVASTCSMKPMGLDEYDVPKYIKTMISLRGMSPDTLHKQASNTGALSAKVDSFKFEFSNGVEATKTKGFVSKNSGQIQDLIDDGAIIKVIQILSSGREKTVFNKTASYDDDDILYAEFLEASLKLL